MQAAYLSDDCYLTFAKPAGAVPADATKKTHGPIRELYKRCGLGVLYAMGEYGLAKRIGKPRIVARDLLEAHHQTYRTFWRWSDAAVDAAVLTGRLHVRRVSALALKIGRVTNNRDVDFSYYGRHRSVKSKPKYLLARQEISK
jgi:hypothetical protein